MTRTFALPSLLGLLLLAPVAAAAQADGTERPLPSAIGVLDVAAKLGALADQPAPSGLGAQDRKSYQEHTAWLRSVVVRLDSAAARIKRARDQATGQANGQRVAAMLSPDMDLLKRQLEQEGRRFNTLSNVLKTRHDIAMNAIRNMK